MVEGDDRARQRRGRARRTTARIQRPASAPSASRVTHAPLVVDEALLPDEGAPGAGDFAEDDATDLVPGEAGQLDTHVMLAAFDDATDVQGG